MANIYDMVDTWNDGGTTFTAIKMDVSDSASAANSLLLDLKVDGVTKASIDKAGNLSANLSISTLDNVVIGATTPAAGTFTTFTSTGIDDNATSTAITIDASENVGIGTTSPAAKFAVSNSGAAGLEFITNYPGGGTGTYIQSYDRSASSYVDTAYLAATHSFRINATEAMRIDASANLLLGTSSNAALDGVKGVVVASNSSCGYAMSDGSGRDYLMYTTGGNWQLWDGTANTARATVDSSGTLITNHNFREKVYNLTGTDINAVNGSVQYKTLAANTTFTESLSDGDSVILRLSGGATYTVTWPTMTWVTSAGNSAPTLGGSDVVVLWQESSVVYGAYVGSYA